MASRGWAPVRRDSTSAARPAGSTPSISARTGERDVHRGRWLRPRHGGQRGCRVRDPHAPLRRDLVRSRNPFGLHASIDVSIAGSSVLPLRPGACDDGAASPSKRASEATRRSRAGSGAVEPEVSPGGGRVRLSRSRARRLRAHTRPEGSAGTRRRPAGHAPLVGGGLPARTGDPSTGTGITPMNECGQLSGTGGRHGADAR